MKRPELACREKGLGGVIASRALRGKITDPHPETGFTLIELLLVLVVMPVLIGAVVAVIIASLDDQAGTATRLSDSADSQITSAFYVRDVQSAAYMTTTSTPATTPWTTPSACGTGTSLVLGLEWPSGTSQDVVSYWQTSLSSAGDGTATAGSKTFTSLTASISVADVGQGIVETDSKGVIPFGTTVTGIDPTSHTLTLSNVLSSTRSSIAFVLGPQLVRNFCSGSSSATTSTVSSDFFAPSTEAVITCPTGAPSTCSGYASTWAPTTGASSITLAIKEPSGQYNYALTAVPRTTSGSIGSTTPGGGTQTVPTFLMTGGGAVVSQSNGSYTVDGVAVINGGYISQSNGTFTATGGIETTNDPTSVACTPAPAKCSDSTTSGELTPISQPIPDPLSGIADPAEGTSRGCPNGGNISGTVSLSPGEYTCGLTIAPGSNVTLTPGIYELDGGLLMKNATLTGYGIMFYLPCNQANTGYGQDTWAPGCTESFQLQNASVTVTPLTGNYPYAGLWFWQNGGDAQTVVLQGPSTAGNPFSFSGYLYAPGAEVSMSSGNSTMTIGGIIANGVTMSNGTATVTGG